MKIRKPALLEKLILFWILVIGALFRFYNLGWGEGFFFHPDENNIAGSISQLEWPKLHPHFFAYGHFSIYLVYFWHQFLSFFKNQAFLTLVPFSQAVYTLRFFSATASVLTILMIYKIAKKIFGSPAAIIAALLTCFVPGLIQAAHFGTTESLLTFILLTTFYLSLKLMDKNPASGVFLSLAFLLGIGLSTKINALVFFSFPCLALALSQRFSLRKAWQKKRLWLYLFLSFVLALAISFLTSPYQYLDFGEFQRIAMYEIGIAQGKVPVFYTRQFLNTIPLLFQLSRIFPYNLNPLLELTGLIGLIFSLFFLTQKNQLHRNKKILLIWAFLIYFLPNSLLFAKWTRFITPVLPFFVLFPLEILIFWQKTKRKLLLNWLAFLLVMAGFLFSLAFFNIYLQPDVRLAATNWMTANLPSQTAILSEAGNVVNLPLKSGLPVINLQFYELEESPIIFNELLTSLTKVEYLLIPSRRIFADHPLDLFPKTACYHQLLFSGRLGFKEIKKFSSYPSLSFGAWPLALPDETAEETWTVFDHPVIRLYQKRFSHPQEEYRQMFDACVRQNQ